MQHLLIVILTIVSGTIAVDYCVDVECGIYTHIGCKNTGDFGPSCPPERSVVTMTADIIELILQRHNTARANVANGKVGSFLTADRMIEMSWDFELASIAEMNAKTCVFAHDKCRNTGNDVTILKHIPTFWKCRVGVNANPQKLAEPYFRVDITLETIAFKYVGQNIAMTSSSPNYKNTVDAINELFDLWYNEYVDCDMNQINLFSTITAASGKSFGNFTQIVMANSSKIGCAIVNYFSGSWRKTYLVCNYAQRNIIGLTIYTTGIPCLGCKSGCSTSYPGLCNPNEEV